MIKILENYLLESSHIFQITITLIISTGLAGILDFIFRKFIDFKYSKELEKFKQTLKSIEKESENDFRKKIGSYDLYVQKQHLALPEIYEKFIIAEGRIIRLYGLREETAFRRIPIPSLISMINDQVTDLVKREEILEKINSGNHEDGIVYLEKYARNKEFSEARASRIALGNALLSNKLFLPKAIDHQFEIIYSQLIEISLSYESNHFHKIPFESKKIESIKEDMNKNKEKLIKSLKSALSGSLN